jgi:hypothetical protein
MTDKLLHRTKLNLDKLTKEKRTITDVDELKEYLTKEKIEAFYIQANEYIKINKEVDKKIMEIKKIDENNIFDINEDVEFDLLLTLMK